MTNDYGHSMRLKGRGENILHLNYEPYGDDKVKFYSFGKIKADSDVVKLSDQMSMIQHVKGEARYLSDKEMRCQREGWTGCIIDKDTSGDYYDKEFPKIITKFADLWEEEIDLLDGNVSPNDKESVREEIKLALWCSNKLPGCTVSRLTGR